MDEYNDVYNQIEEFDDLENQVDEDDEDEEEKEEEEKEDGEDDNEPEDYIIADTDKSTAEIELRGAQRTTPPFLYKLEKARWLAFRAKRLQEGVAPVISIPSITKRNLCRDASRIQKCLHERDYIEIAKEEMRQRVIPYRLKRHGRVAGTYELWSIQDFMYVDRD